MPLYDYDCANCGRRFEVLHGVFADGPEACPLCGGGPVRKAITAAAVHYKGAGWAKKERHASASRSTSKTGDESTVTGDAGDSSATASSGDSSDAGGSAGSENASDGGTTAKTAGSDGDGPKKPRKSESTTKIKSGSAASSD